MTSLSAFISCFATMHEPVRQYLKSLRHKEYGELERIWLDLLEVEPATEELLRLVETTEREAPGFDTVPMLWLLADTLKDKNRHDKQMRVLEMLTTRSPDENRLARELADCCRSIYQAGETLERMFTKCGLGFGQPVAVALASLQRHLPFLPGSWVFDPRQGPGKVQNLDLLLDRVTVAFETRGPLVEAITQASHHLRATHRDGFFWRLEHSPDRLASLAREDPVELVRLYLRDTGEAATAGDLKTALSVVMTPGTWDTLWARARRGLESDPHIAIRTKPARAYQWSETPVKRQDRAAGPARAPEDQVVAAPSELARLSEEAVVALFQSQTNYAQRLRLLGRIAESRPDDWPGLASAIFLASSDRRIRALVEREVSQRWPDSWQALQERVLTGYRRHPDAFIWLLENAERLSSANPAQLVSRALDLLESSDQRRIWSKLAALLRAEDHRMIRLALEGMDESGARTLLGSVERARVFRQYEKDEIGGVVQQRFPALAPRAPEGGILSTARGIEKANAELRELVTKELPASADEIGRARAHGDLSENYEYKAAREKQARLMARINRLRGDLARSSPLDLSGVDTSRVSVGARVALEGDTGHHVVYTILGPWDSDPENGILSYLTPLSQQLLGKRIGESVELDGCRFTIKTITTSSLG